MCQSTFSEQGFEKHRKKTCREQFLEDMDQIIPWAELAAAIEPLYPNPQGAVRRPIGNVRMLPNYFLHHGFNLSDLAVEKRLYDSRAMRHFVGIDLGREPMPDETTVCKFRHLLEAHDLGERHFVLIQDYLLENGMQINGGKIVDATIIDAPSSTNNQNKQRDPEMRQTKKAKQSYFGMKAHIGADGKAKLIHAVVATAANVHYSQVVGDLLHGDETRVWGDSAYSGQQETIRLHAPQAKDFTQRKEHRHRPLSDRAIGPNRGSAPRGSNRCRC